MKRMTFLTIGIFLMPFGFGQTVLLECGQNSGKNFNGWYISPHSLFDAIEFDDHSTSFFSEYGGIFTITLTKKIEELKDYETLNILFNFDEINNAQLENVVYYTSVDGKHWDAIQNSENNTAISIKNDSLDISYVRADAQATFYNNGKIACDYVKIEGDRKVSADLAEVEILDEPIENSFYIFNFAHTVNVETGLEEPYDILITALSGQIVFRERYVGSKRVELPADLSGIYIVTIIQNNAFQATKKIMVSQQ